MAVRDGKDIKDDSITPADLAPANADGLAALLCLRVPFSAGVTGTADDVTVLEEAPFGFRIVDVQLRVSTAKADATVQLRTASGGGGSALSTALSVASTGRVEDASTATSTVAAEGAIYLRRSDRACAGEALIFFVKS